MEEWLEALELMMLEKKDEKKALQMEAYMKGLFPYYGITAPVRKDIFRELWLAGKNTVQENFRDIVNILWDKKAREYQYVANDILKKQLKALTAEDIDWIESLITKKSWWDTVDFLSPSCIGIILKSNPTLVEPTVNKWVKSGNKWLIRSSILFQLKYKHDVDIDLLFRLIVSQIGSKEFFINKAAGWSLRQLARVEPEQVKQFVNQHPNLANLTKREALKHFI